jgi:hypothetical protein
MKLTKSRMQKIFNQQKQTRKRLCKNIPTNKLTRRCKKDFNLHNLTLKYKKTL